MHRPEDAPNVATVVAPNGRHTRSCKGCSSTQAQEVMEDVNTKGKTFLQTQTNMQTYRLHIKNVSRNVSWLESRSALLV